VVVFVKIGCLVPKHFVTLFGIQLGEGAAS